MAPLANVHRVAKARIKPEIGFDKIASQGEEIARRFGRDVYSAINLIHASVEQDTEGRTAFSPILAHKPEYSYEGDYFANKSRSHLLNHQPY